MKITILQAHNLTLECILEPAKECANSGLVRGSIKLFVKSKIQASKAFLVESVEGIVPSRCTEDALRRYTFGGKVDIPRYETLEGAIKDINERLETLMEKYHVTVK